MPGWCVALYVSWTTMAVACCDVSKKDCRTTLCFHHLFIHCGSVKMWTFRSRKKMVNCKRWMWPQPVLLSRRSDRNWTIRWIRWGSWKEIEDLRANVLHLEAFIVCRPGPPEVEDHLMNPWCVENGICHQVIVLTRNMMISWSLYQWISRSPKFRQIHVEFCVNHVPKRSHHIFKNIFLGDGSATFNIQKQHVFIEKSQDSWVRWCDDNAWFIFLGELDLVWPMEVTYGGSRRWLTMFPIFLRHLSPCSKAPKHLSTSFFPSKSTGSWNFRTAARMNDFNRWNRLSWNSSKLSKRMGTPCAACWIAASRGCDLPSFAEVMLIPVRTWSHGMPGFA